MPVYHTLDDLERDLRTIARETKPKMARIVAGVARDGNRLGKSNARRTAGAHGKYYPDAFSAEAITPLKWEWGPDANHPDGQGGMSFEGGSRNQPAHHDIAKAADVYGAGYLAGKVRRGLDDLFWPA